MTTWPRCGHPRTPENTQGVGRYRNGCCRECRRKVSREWARTRAAEIRSTRPEVMTVAQREDLIVKVRAELLQCRLEMLARIGA